MKLYLDCSMGASGDMLMAALYELLPDKAAFRESIDRLGLPGVALEYMESVKCGIKGTHISVTVSGAEEVSEDAFIPDGRHNHGHSHGHSHGHEHEHEHEDEHHGGGGKKRIKIKVKDSSGLISVDRQIHDGAITISASLTVVTDDLAFNEFIAGEIESAARDITRRGGIVGHIKASVSTTATSMISASDDKAMVKESAMRRCRIIFVAIVFLVDPAEAESVVKAALGRIRARSN